MREVNEMKATAIAIVLGGLLAGVAHAAPSEAEQHQVWEDVGQAAKKGPIDVPLAEEAVLHVPDGEVFVPQPQATRLMNLYGNPGDHSAMSGLILPRDPKTDWYMSVTFVKEGYIKDDDARKWDVEGMLKGLTESTEEQNKEREKAGVPGLEILGWSEPPRYDGARQRLVWALKAREAGARADEPLTVNYNTYALGRDGYFSMNMVTSLDALPQLKPVAEQQLAALDYNAGKRYSDFDAKTDHVAEYGLAALVVGVAAHKLGFIALAGAFLLKFAKLIFIGLAVAGGGIARFFKRGTKPQPAAAVAAPPAFANTVIDPPAPSLPPLEFDGRNGAPPAPPHDR